MMDRFPGTTHVSQKAPLYSSISPDNLPGKKSIFDESGSWTGSRDLTSVDVAMQKGNES